MAEKKFSEFDEPTALGESDHFIGLENGDNAKIPIDVARTRLNTGDQEFTANVKAQSFEGNGANLTGITAAGVGGTSSTSNLSLVCNSDDSTPAAKIVASKFDQDLYEADENGFKVRTEIPYTHEDDAIPFAKDLNLNNKYRLRDQSQLDSWPFPFGRFDGVNDYVQVPDNPNINFKTDDFAISGFFRTSANYSAASGFIINKRSGSGNGYSIRIDTNNKLEFIYDSGTAVSITSDSAVNDGLFHSFFYVADRDGNLSMYLDSKLQTDAKAIDDTDITITPNFWLGSASGGASNFFTGDVTINLLWNKLPTLPEIKKYSNPLAALEGVDHRASQVEQTSGTLTIGKAYRTNDFIAGDDFSNVASTGASANVDGAEWIAIGTTPTTWTNSSALVKIGCIAEWDFRNITNQTLFESQNGNHGLISGMSTENLPVVGRGEPYNWILNGDHPINQLGLAGAVAANNATYEGTDQWETLLSGITANIELVTASQPTLLKGSQSLKYTATSTASGTLGSTQYIEDYEKIQGNKITVYGYVKSNSANARLLSVETGGNIASSNSHSGGGGWELLFSTVDVDSTITAYQLRAQIISSSGTAVSITSGDYIEFTGVGLVLGDRYAPFIPRDFDLEQEKAFRYKFRKASGASDPDEYIANGNAISTTQAEGFIQFPKPMRSGPQLSLSAATHFAVRDLGVDITTTALTVSKVTERGCNFLATVAAGLVAGHSIQLKIDNNAAAYMDFDDQL